MRNYARSMEKGPDELPQTRDAEEPITGPEDELYPDLPPVPDWAVEAWRKIPLEDVMMPGGRTRWAPQPKVRAAMRYVLAGETLAEASRRTGSSTSNISQRLRYYKLREKQLCSETIVHTAREIVHAGQQELLNRLQYKPKEVKTNELTKAVSEATSTVARYERWGEPHQREGSYVSALMEAMQNLAPGGRVSATITLERERGEEKLVGEGTTTQGGATHGFEGAAPESSVSVDGSADVRDRER